MNGRSQPPVTGDLPSVAYAAALAAVPWFGPARLRRLLDHWSPPDAWVAARSGRATDVWAAGDPPSRRLKAEPLVRAAIAKVEPARVWERIVATGVGVHVHGSPGYPALLADDLAPPVVLFSLGDTAVLDGRRVTIVGTRNATAAGREVAAEMGAGLAAQGVRVVSGLARGIDGWAHRGALSVDGGAPPVGVVAGGLDVVYPPEHRRLWFEVAERGLLLSEVPPGVAPHAFRFPLRNRILAALGELVVVVESRAKGGSLHTVDEAIDRGVTVLAVPGSPRNPAAEGTNRLLLDGAGPVVASGDVLIALGFESPQAREIRPEHPAVASHDRWALQLLGTDQLDLDALVQLSGRDLVEVAATMGRLQLDGWVERRAGWFEQTRRSAGSRR